MKKEKSGIVQGEKLEINRMKGKKRDDKMIEKRS